MTFDFCQMIHNGLEQGACLTEKDKKESPACRVTLRRKKNQYERLIRSMHLSRPEDYYSIYQSGCNHSCLKCHSHYFSKVASGEWMSTDQIAELSGEYLETVTVEEPRERATMWHAGDLCQHCGACVLEQRKSPHCPQKLDLHQVVLSPQGWGPARNIIAFTGGDIACQPQFYAEVAEKIKDQGKGWILLESNGYGLIPENLDILASGGIDSFWLDIKAYDEDVYRKLCGTSNAQILQSVQEIIDRNFVLEVLTLYIPGWVETNDHVQIARLVAETDPTIPTTLLAFFPEYILKNVRSPSFGAMIKSFAAMRNEGLKNLRFGNIGMFCRTVEERNLLHTLFGDRIT